MASEWIPVLALAAVLTTAQVPKESPVRWSADVEQPSRPGGNLEVHLEATIQEGWHLYSATQVAGGPNQTRVKLISDGPFSVNGKVRQSPPTKEFDPTFGIQAEYFLLYADFWLPVQVDPNAEPGVYEMRLQVTYQVCNDNVCLPPKKLPVVVKVEISEPGLHECRQLATPAAGVQRQWRRKTAPVSATKA